jgi:hypothetical protein
MLKNGNVASIRDYSSIGVFPVAVYPIVFVFQKTDGPDETTYEKMKYSATRQIESELKIKTKLNKKSAGEEWQFETGGNSGQDDTKFQKLGEVASITDAATVSEAYELKNLIIEKRKPHAGDLKLVNSGTIDPYVNFWGTRPTRYIKESYKFPVLEVKQQGRYAANRVRQGK